MATTIAEHYAEELDRNSRQLITYRMEMIEMGDRLAEVIRRNTIPGIAELVEEQQTRLNQVAKKFDSLQAQFQKQKAALKPGKDFVDDSQINAETETLQNQLRRKMHTSEKEYIDAKHGCLKFLSDILKKR